MNKIIRLWNQHRKGFIMVVAAIALLLIFIHVLNNAIIENRKKSTTNDVELTEEEKNLPTKSIISKDKVDIETTKKNVSEIDEFVEKCNNGDIAGAYNMLTNDCKEALFQTQDVFRVKYYNSIFTEKRIVNVDNFLSDNNRYTYLVEYSSDLLAMGSVTSSNSSKDYITIDENKTGGKLNIGGLIYTKNINKENDYNGIKVKVLSQEIYKDNEKFNITVENKSQKRIAITADRYAKGIYATDAKGTKYNSNVSEIASNLCDIPSSLYRTYTFKFSKIYSSGLETKAITFSDIVPDYEQFKISPNETKDRVQISVIL